MKKRTVRLQNIYNGDVVFTDDYENVKETDGIKFIQAYTENNINRKFLVNRDAFKILTK